MRNAIAAALHRLGAEITVNHRGHTALLTAVIQPDFSREDTLPGEIGYGTARRYRLYAPCGQFTPLLTQGSRVTGQGKQFQVERVEDYYVGGQAVYRKARLLLLEGGDSSDPSGYPG